MAKASIRYEWATGEKLTSRVEVDSSFPDAVSEARAQARTLFGDAWGIVDDDEPAKPDATDG